MITVEILVNQGIDKVWSDWTEAERVKKWNYASDDWECPRATNNLEVGGKFSYIMAAKDGSNSFDFNGVYTAVEPKRLIEYQLEDGRKVAITFEAMGEGLTKVVETFDAEMENSEEKQREGWQAILDNFKKYSEGN